MGRYYQDRLHGNNLKRCYDIAPPRIQQYLSAEIDYVLRRIPHNCLALELRCGYGRVLQHLVPKTDVLVGIDTSQTNIDLGMYFLRDCHNCHLLIMNAIALAFPDNTFDGVICIQNGISAFHVGKKSLIRESIRVTKSRGLVMFSSYSEKIWVQRLQWFEAQAEASLIGEIDHEKTRNGIIVCRDGFMATTVGPEEFEELAHGFPVDVHIEEVDESSIFCVMTVHENP